MRGRGTSAKEQHKKERVHDIKTRERIKEDSQKKFNLKRAEKEKVKREISQLDNLDDVLNFHPITALKKLKTK